MAGAAVQSVMSGSTTAASGQTRDAVPRATSTTATSATMTAARATAGHIVRQMSRAAPDTMRSVCEAVCHSSRLRLVTKRRHSVRAMASAETSAWCGRKTMASATCCKLVSASRPVAA
jgi:hypothetical protein